MNHKNYCSKKGGPIPDNPEMTPEQDLWVAVLSTFFGDMERLTMARSKWHDKMSVRKNWYRVRKDELIAEFKTPGIHGMCHLAGINHSRALKWLIKASYQTASQLKWYKRNK